MSDLEFVGKVKMARLTSLEEDFRESQRQYRQDEADREARRRGLGKVVASRTLVKLAKSRVLRNPY